MLNRAILMGRLTRDPELRHTATGIPVTSFTLAVDRGVSKDREQAGAQTVDFIDIVAWRSTAEFAAKWFHKGQLVAVSGRIQVRNWKDQQDNNRRSTEVVADEVFFAESKRDGQSGPNPLPDAVKTSDFAEPNFPAPKSSSMEFNEILGDDEDLPF